LSLSCDLRRCCVTRDRTRGSTTQSSQMEYMSIIGTRSNGAPQNGSFLCATIVTMTKWRSSHLSRERLSRVANGNTRFMQLYSASIDHLVGEGFVCEAYVGSMIIKTNDERRIRFPRRFRIERSEFTVLDVKERCLKFLLKYRIRPLRLLEGIAIARKIAKSFRPSSRSKGSRDTTPDAMKLDEMITNVIDNLDRQSIVT